MTDARNDHVLVVYAHPNPASFTHAVLDEIVRGLADAGHSYEVLDLYAIGFDPVFSQHDSTQFIHHTLPEGTFDRPTLERILIEGAGNPLKRFMAKRWVKDKSLAEIVELFEANQPADVRAHQAKVARSQGLIFVAPVFWMGLPAILKGWLERVFAYGFAYTLSDRGWAGELDGRIPMLNQRKGLIVTPTFFTETEYDTGWRAAMDTILCDWNLKMAGVKEASHVYLYAVNAVEPGKRQEYLERAYSLGLDF
jgi:NAD(P)H dehydrogenase (quinone)